MPSTDTDSVSLVKSFGTQARWGKFSFKKKHDTAKKRDENSKEKGKKEGEGITEGLIGARDRRRGMEVE